MTTFRMLIVRLLALFKRGRLAATLDEEIRAHLELLTDAHLRRGLMLNDAREAARREFGGVQQVKESHRDHRGLPWLDDLGRDVRHAARALVKTPGFTAAAVVTLALGIGANATVFSIVNSILLRPLPYRDADRLVHIVETIPAGESMSGAAERTATMTPETYTAWRAQTRTLSDMALHRPVSKTLTRRGDAVRLNGFQVSSALLPMLGVAPRLGRLFDADEEKSGAGRVVILSHTAWLTEFGGDAGIIGRPLSLEDGTYTVVGVMPPGFAFPDVATDFWAPLVLTFEPGQFMRFEVIARLKEGISLDAAATEAGTLSRELLGASRVEIVGWKDELVAPVRPALLVFAIAVTLVLLIACVNVANLFLARAAIRRREIAIRMALGAGRQRVLRQLLTESLMLALLGGVAGCALAMAGTRFLSALGQGLARFDLARVDSGGNTIPRLNEVSLDATVLLYMLVITIVVGVAFGLSPIRSLRRIEGIHATRSHAAWAPALRSSAGSFRHAPQSARRLLIVGQVALSMILLLGAGLLVRSFTNLTTVKLGYDSTKVLTFQLTQRELSWPPVAGAQARQTAFAEEVVARVRSIPGVDAAAFANLLPMVQMQVVLALSDARGADAKRFPNGNVLTVSQDYFRVMGMRVTAGRGFAESGRANGMRSFVMNETLARQYFGELNPIGRIVYLGGRGAGAVVGVVSDVHQSSLATGTEPQLFIDPHQTVGNIPVERGGLYFVVRTDSPAAALVPQIRSIVSGIDRSIPLHNVATMDQIVANSISTPRSYAVLLGLFAFVALSLAIAGLYGVLAYFVGQRTQELGVRLALGAQTRDVLVLVMRQGLAVTGAGIVLGLAGGAALSRYLERMLFGLAPLDPTTFVAVPLLFFIVAALACVIPARYATKVDPLVALRYE